MENWRYGRVWALGMGEAIDRWMARYKWYKGKKEEEEKSH
jgi:hypothetical protein